jgi:hypothetical protein
MGVSVFSGLSGGTCLCMDGANLVSYTHTLAYT